MTTTPIDLEGAERVCNAQDDGEEGQVAYYNLCYSENDVITSLVAWAREALPFLEGMLDFLKEEIGKEHSDFQETRKQQVAQLESLIARVKL
jgi:hypothetical protein